MARNFSFLTFLKKKAFWILGAVLVFILVSVIILTKESSTSQLALEGPFLTDTFLPLSAIVSPRGGSWHREDFKVEIRDSDIGSGLQEFMFRSQGCQYFVEDLKTKERMGNFRRCGKATILVPVGTKGVCSSSYDPTNLSAGKCRVHTQSFDKAHNSSGWESTLFNIDLIPPLIEPISLPPELLAPNQEYAFQTRVLDNNHITGCTLYQDGNVVPSSVDLDPIYCSDGISCKVSSSYSFKDPGRHEVLFGCQDVAGNVAYGKPVSFLVFVNSPPKIEYCKVTPAEGFFSTTFQFSVEAKDPDQDTLSFQWDFGDGKTSQDPSPSHRYMNPGTYTPTVLTQDLDGASATCNTAWVVVRE